MSEKEKLSDIEFRLAMNFMEQIPFNKFIGLTPHSVGFDEAVFKINMRPELVGNWLQGILHGGVIATALDVAGGTIALMGAYARMGDVPKEEKPKRLAKLGTIDMRVDYLRPGKGKEFFAHATILRIGNKVAVTRMEFKNEEGELIAVGTGTYLCG